MNRCLRPLACFATVAVFTLLPVKVTAKPHHQHQAKSSKAADKADKKAHGAKASHDKTAREKTSGKRRHAKRDDDERKSAKAKSALSKSADSDKGPAPEKPAPPQLSGDLAAIKDAILAARRGRTSDATDIQARITDPVGRKLVEWYLLRHSESQANFSRYAEFIAANPDWPSMSLLRRQAEARLWQERSDAATVHGFTLDQPISAKGKFALARVLLAAGDRDGAARLVREAWRSDELSDRTESDAYDAFHDLLTSADHRARMDKRIGAKDLAGARRAAKRLGSDELAIVKACGAVREQSKKAQDALDDVPADARRDLGYTLCRIQWLMAENRIDDAARVTIAAAPETMAQQDTDQWWRERRLLARKLLDQGKFQTAYDVVRPAALPDNPYYRSDMHFMRGWIALRYLDDAKTAAAHFARIDEGQINPTVLSRAAYWRGRAAEALGNTAAMRADYEAAARYPTAYYGQLALAKLGRESVHLHAPSPAALAGRAAGDERVRAADMLYEIGEPDVVLYFVADLAEQSSDVDMLQALGELTGRRNDARAMLQIGKTALGRGLAFDHYAFPIIGIPKHSPIAPDIGRSMTYSVARTESAFDQRDKSSANAVGLMQVTPEAGRDTAKRFKVSYDWDRLVSDPVYNTQMGAAELSALQSEYHGCHIMIFAGYNAGRGRVRDWVKAYGDPRDPNVDPVDWVERIPISETRNYVQRVMENLAVYRARFEDAGTAVAAKGGDVMTQETNAAPAATAIPSQ
ncbi:lytic transglycosylase domain-containing protein [Bradyrhizobium sp. ISRA443]|uniref:lytic transglycosylase domain-containing protein n=1 Tax=unclassified Bradyrhizobium TaxID=2631580 RepID=UPI00247A37E1|nr:MULTISPECIES: lytic transglycosylase domain-containing protein [unclassified Bradyrhizobium]WGS02447.1 lytic transglycosylase domain-containing protein [Bradyrhizobium sp. ISRA436]WGS09332.1 lytic transglycosylase domain-containing protein [Bradyrhizobium sp. ISRA437]WGS16221.1 lytic transglycosylase domain-containing protein [Bradyrhizobium sp. ISRA443]